MKYDTDAELLEAAYIEVLKEAKTYIVYIDGDEVGTIKAGSHNAAEKKAKAKYPGKNVSVTYTEESVQRDETLTEGTHKCDKCGKPMGKHHNEEKAKKGYKYCQSCDRTYSPESQTKIDGKGISAPSVKKESLESLDEQTYPPGHMYNPMHSLHTLYEPPTPDTQTTDPQNIRKVNQHATIQHGAPEASYKEMPLYQLARIIQKDWKNVNFGAVPYLQAMSTLSDINDNYDMDSGRSIVAYFLSNAGTWKGPIAIAVKTELKKRLKG